MSSLPVDCRFSTYRAKLRSRVDGFVSEFDHNSKSAPAASNCKLKAVCVNFKFPLKEKKVLVDQTTRLCFDRTAVWYWVRSKSRDILIIDSRRECRDRAFAR